jgi:plasmid replication initiation protein
MVSLEGTKNKTLKQSNLITASRYEFGVVEKRIIYLIIEKLNGIENEAIQEAKIDEGLTLTINYRPVLEVCELWSENQNKNHAYVREAIDSLLSRKYTIQHNLEEDGTLCPVEDKFVLVAQSRAYIGKTLVKILVPKMALKYFSQFKKGNYTNFNMFNAMTLQSQYSQRLYEQCSRWKDTKWFTLPLDRMKEVLNITDGYTITKIKKQILDVAQKELKEKTDLSFRYEPKKEGKKIVAFVFNVVLRPDNSHINNPTPPDAVVELILC